MTEVLVTEADRLAAAKYALNQIGLGDAAMRIRTGGMDDHHLVQAFAAHRIAGQAELRAALELGAAQLASIREANDAENPESYRADDREGCLDWTFAMAEETEKALRQALSAAPFKGGIA
jgi:hypothetical protein